MVSITLYIAGAQQLGATPSTAYLQPLHILGSLPHLSSLKKSFMPSIMLQHFDDLCAHSAKQRETTAIPTRITPIATIIGIDTS